jgi:hypothetical protein
MDWNQYFEMLKDWKLLPAYKAEPRIDCLIGYYLPQILSDFLTIEILGIIPELPIRLATVKPTHEGTTYADRSYKVDFLVLGNNNLNYLVEFKTDSNSRRDEQDRYLMEAKACGTKSIMEGIIQIANVSTYELKYKHLKNKLKDYGLIDYDNKYTGMNPSFEIIYIQPSNYRNEENVIDFQWICNWLKENHPNSEFETALADALFSWSSH